MNPKVIQNLLLLMMRGSKPVYLTAGKIFPLTMVMFCSVRYRNVFDSNYYCTKIYLI